MTWIGYPDMHGCMTGKLDEMDFIEMRRTSREGFQERDFKRGTSMTGLQQNGFSRSNFRIGKSYRDVRTVIAEQGPQERTNQARNAEQG